MYSSEAPISQLSSRNYKNQHIKLLQKYGGSQKDPDVAGLYFVKYYFDSKINLLQQQNKSK